MTEAVTNTSSTTCLNNSLNRVRTIKPNCSKSKAKEKEQDEEDLRKSISSSISPLSTDDPRWTRWPSLIMLANRFVVAKASGSNSKCVDVLTGKHFVCKTLSRWSASTLLRAHHLASTHTCHVSRVAHVVDAADRVHVLLEDGRGDLHAHVRRRRRLPEQEARVLFAQVARAVHVAHQVGVVVRDLKLRKFVFVDDHTQMVRLESLEDCVVLTDPDDDALSDKHGCPAYVSPEVLRCENNAYSGRAADMWGLGVLLYTMLVGRYPFQGEEHACLFAQIRTGNFVVPEHISPWARSLLHSLLNLCPELRPNTEDVLSHPWLTRSKCGINNCKDDRDVPQLNARQVVHRRRKRRFEPLQH